MLVPWSLTGIDSCNFVEISLYQFFFYVLVTHLKKKNCPVLSITQTLLFLHRYFPAGFLFPSTRQFFVGVAGATPENE